MTEIEVVLSFISLFTFILTNNISNLYRNIGLLLFESVSCIFVSIVLILRSKVNNSLLPTVALISYSVITGFIGSIITMFTAFFLGANIIDFGTIVLSLYFGLVTFRTCIFTGFKSLLVTIIKSPTLKPKDNNIAPIFYSALLAYFSTFLSIIDSNSKIMKWPNFTLLGAILGRFIGTLYKLFTKRSQSLNNKKESLETIKTNQRHKL
ncbi:uncharacterized protein cubi_03399 [Cryptosporidium ubiquitum]|uniref:Uncharacterized protein n=1 Tax=Cryptosporidium ubiquitum TaxID=857276 RepID=A0A1J4MH85_9CRYT|nr:uncharacterized protein cubi_03399 [Cryptosporidium ubiquitum]OII73601.1 hypothetical protein cubi_03399 [Cryptosporidium ubiquitum]